MKCYYGARHYEMLFGNTRESQLYKLKIIRLPASDVLPALLFQIW